MEVDPPRPDAAVVDLPTVLMLHVPLSFFWNGRSDPAMFRWMATIQPGYREAWAAIGALLIARNVDWWSAEWANRAFLEPFLEPFAPIGRNARMLLGLALGQKEQGSGDWRPMSCAWRSRTVASTPQALAEGLTATVAIDCDRPNRWAISLADVAAYSDANARVVAEAIGLTLPPWVSARPRSSCHCSGFSTNCWPALTPRPSRTLARPWRAWGVRAARPVAWRDRSWPGADAGPFREPRLSSARDGPDRARAAPA